MQPRYHEYFHQPPLRRIDAVERWAGHSRHGEAFDSGPRQKRWIMAGIGTECPHCMEQLQSLAAKISQWEKLDTAVFAASSARVNPDAAERGRLESRLSVLTGIRQMRSVARAGE